VVSTLLRSLTRHRYRTAIVATLVVAVAAAAWYLGSPLFLISYADEAPPTTTILPAAGSVPTTEETPVAARVLTRGELGSVDSLHNGTGEVRLLEVGTSRFLRFESVAITNAPDIHIYLSTDTGGRYVEENTLYLGALRATTGSFNYQIPAGTALERYRSVVVWCRNFSTLITWADLR